MSHEGVAGRRERAQLYRAVYEEFCRTYPPSRHLLRSWRGRLRATLGRLIRRRAAAGSADSGGERKVRV